MSDQISEGPVDDGPDDFGADVLGVLAEQAWSSHRSQHGARGRPHREVEPRLPGHGHRHRLNRDADHRACDPPNQAEKAPIARPSGPITDELVGGQAGCFPSVRRRPPCLAIWLGAPSRDRQCHLGGAPQDGVWPGDDLVVGALGSAGAARLGSSLVADQSQADPRPHRAQAATGPGTTR